MMASVHKDPGDWFALSGTCECDGETRTVSISALGVEGCTIESEHVWSAELDFVHLVIAGSTEMNGRIVRVVGKRAEVRFFGQLHPAAVARLAGPA